MGFEQDLARVQAARHAERKIAAEEQGRMEREMSTLLDEASRYLAEAAEVLSGARIPITEARVAHKERHAWQWPAGRRELEGGS